MGSFSSVSRLLCILLLVVVPVRVISSGSLENILVERLRFSPMQIEELLAQPIPDHARREIDYGFVEEDFVRFMMGVLLVRHKIQFLDQTRLNRMGPSIQADSRYRCASIGLNIGGGFENDCLYLWTEFLVKGSNFSYDLSGSAVQNAGSTSSDASLEFDKQRAKEFIESYKIPAYMHDDLLSLKIRGGDLLDVIRETAKHPPEEFREEMLKIGQQPPIARRFGRIVCASRLALFGQLSTPWDRTCYAYWHRYMDMGGDGDTISDAHRNSAEQDPRQRDFRPPPPSRAQADIGERVMHGFMWKAIDDQMCKSKSAACSRTLKKVVDDCRERNESLRQAYLDDPQGDDKYEALQDSIHECVTDDKRLAPYLPIND